MVANLAIIYDNMISNFDAEIFVEVDRNDGRTFGRFQYETGPRRRLEVWQRVFWRRRERKNSVFLQRDQRISEIVKVVTEPGVIAVAILAVVRLTERGTVHRKIQKLKFTPL